MTDRIRTTIAKKPIAYLGIDPGKSGAVALLISSPLEQNRGRNRVRFYDWPKTDNLNEVLRAMEEWNRTYDIKLGILERSQPRPTDGVKQAFGTGRNFGRWEVIISSLGIPHHFITPQKWQKGIGIVKSDGATPKIRAWNILPRIFPEFPIGLFLGPKGGKKDGRVDALLIAGYGKMLDQGMLIGK